MSKLKLILALCCLLACLLPNSFAQTAQPNTPATVTATPIAANPEAQLLRAILEELRLQRAVLQRTYINSYRAQMLTERLAQQQARVDNLNEETTQLKAEIQQSQNPSEDEEELKDLVVTINETADPQQRAALVQSYKSMKRLLERQREFARQEAEHNRERQQQLEIALRVEQFKLAELQEQLDALDREFEKQLGDAPKTR